MVPYIFINVICSFTSLISCRVYELDEDGNRIRDQNGEFLFPENSQAVIIVYG